MIAQLLKGCLIMVCATCVAYTVIDLWQNKHQGQLVVEALEEQEVIQQTWIGDGTIAVLYDTQNTNLHECMMTQQETYLRPIKENTFSTQWRFTHCQLVND